MENLVILPASAFLLSYHALLLILVDLFCHNTGRSRCLYPQCVRYSSKTTGAVQSSRKTSDSRRTSSPASGVGKTRGPRPPQSGRPRKPRTLSPDTTGARVPGLGKKDPGAHGALAQPLRSPRCCATGASGTPQRPSCARARPPRRLATCEAAGSSRHVNSSRPRRV